MQSNALAQRLELDETRGIELAVAAGRGATESVLSLLSLGANPNLHQKKFGLTAVMIAAIGISAAAAASTGSDSKHGLTSSQQQTKTAAPSSAGSGGGSDSGSSSGGGSSADPQSMTNSYNPALQHLIAAGGDVNASDKFGKTALSTCGVICGGLTDRPTRYGDMM